ncbi:MAG: formamidopyrimidine/5-formyluracil/5-hydroxymethyluracil glycosylase, partial [Patescibacteria group bacterium]|nr:formamidopyrimidine/5-formyluracil/5-hydroxymethyluracil glycosylase [Patescibacteria group bacterium]
MPELPEVETIRRGLESRLIGAVISDIEVRAPKIFDGDPEGVIGTPIIALTRQGKLL